jgi:ubiquinone/menaquinone biosynthesis C-methylase UbiE
MRAGTSTGRPQWHDPRMSQMADRYDRLAARYERWWAPVLAPTARRLADELAPLIAEHPDARILDLGAGTGTLAIELLRRHPTVTVLAVDPSKGMLAEARAQARRQLDRAGQRRLEEHRAEAADLRLPEGAFDAVVSTFVLQLVPDRFAALREARRVLRPDGTLATVTWLNDDRIFEPDEALEDAIDELDLAIDEEPDDHRSGNFPSPQAATAQVRRAGFRDVRAVEGELVHAYDPAEYLDFLEQYAERGLFDGLDRRDRDRLREATANRLGRLAVDEFVWRARVVTVTGRRSS